MTLLGLYILSIFPIAAIIRLGSQRGEEWDAVSEWRTKVLADRYAANPKLKR